ncbi:S1C family serine protease [Bacillus sp. FJAT-22090]|uniref:S1C family serine protease n=1 Tax=Bacillus sp. FJAT-22090 TaxID=1581038 RepID=UPI0011A45B4A|nr:serine protease [Bacillus sp. FJAT-22090]
MDQKDKKDKYKWDEEDMDETVADEEFLEFVLEAQREALLEEAQERTNPKTKRPFPRWIFWIMATVLFINTFAVIFQIYSIPAIEFLKTSARLSVQEDIALYKESVVVVLSEDSKGTGFSISSSGTILTNYHVIEGNDTVIVGFPEDGRFKANVIHTYPDVDLAVLEVEGEDLPHLDLASKKSFIKDDPVTFIGNPLNFTGIANEGTILDEYLLSDWDVPVVMMKAPVYRGNSGSPVLNKDGQVIGVVFATLDLKEYGKVGLFVPIEEYYKKL